MARSGQITSFNGLIIAAISFCSFCLLHILLKYTGFPSYVKETDHWKWKNLFQSWIHAILVGSACIFSICAFPGLLADMIDFINPFTFAVVAASTGYFVWDFVDIVASGQISLMKEVLLHHVAVLSIFVYNIYECRYIGYTIVALFVEVNSIFLHLRKLMQMCDVGFQHPAYRFVSILNLVSFIGCRFMFSLSLISYGLVVYFHRMSTFYYCILSVTMFIMWVVNGVLFWRLIKNDVLRNQKHSNNNNEYKTTVTNNNSQQKSS